MNASAFQWVEPQPVTVPQEIADLVGDQPILSAALVRRGYSNRQHAQAFLDLIGRMKPASAKGVYVKKVSLAGTMTPGVIVQA